MKYLGYANGWHPPVPMKRVDGRWVVDESQRVDHTPQIVKDCQAKGHKTQYTQIGRCLSACTCTECDYTYKMDSSD